MGNDTLGGFREVSGGMGENSMILRVSSNQSDAAILRCNTRFHFFHIIYAYESSLYLLVSKNLFTLWFTTFLTFALFPTVEPYISSHCLQLCNPPILLQSLDSHPMLLSLVFRVLAPHPPATPSPGFSHSPAAKPRHPLFQPLPHHLFFISIARKERQKQHGAPVSLSNHSLEPPLAFCRSSNFLNTLRLFFNCFYKCLEVLKWIQCASAWMAWNQLFLFYTKRQMCIWCLWWLSLFRDLYVSACRLLQHDKNLRSI